MKTLIYFFSCFSLMVLVGCSSEQKCFDAQMKAWDTAETNTSYHLGTNKIIQYKSFNDKAYWIVVKGNPANGKAEYEADAWARCMKK